MVKKILCTAFVALLSLFVIPLKAQEENKGMVLKALTFLNQDEDVISSLPVMAGTVLKFNSDSVIYTSFGQKKSVSLDDVFSFTHERKPASAFEIFLKDEEGDFGNLSGFFILLGEIDGGLGQTHARITDLNGVAKFTDLAPGFYNIQVIDSGGSVLKNFENIVHGYDDFVELSLNAKENAVEVVINDPTSFELYDLGGRKVNPDLLPPGIYIRHNPDGSSEKILIR